MILLVKNLGQAQLGDSYTLHPSIQVIWLYLGGGWAGLEGPDGFIPWLVSWWGWLEGWAQLDSCTEHLHITSPMCT